MRKEIYKEGSRFNYKGNKYRVVILSGETSNQIGLTWGGKIKGAVQGDKDNITKELLIQLAESIRE